MGEDVLIDSTAIIVGAQNISIGSHERIDAFTSLICSADGYSAIGSYVHIGAYSYIAASHGVVIDDFAALSQGCRLYSAPDDYSGEAMTNATLPVSLRIVESGLVHIRSTKLPHRHFCRIFGIRAMYPITTTLSFDTVTILGLP